MSKRFTDTNIWGEDWFLDMPNEYKLFWFYILSECDHAGVFKVNVKSFCGLLGVKLTSTKALEYINNGKQRIRVISDSVWLIEDFFSFQYGHTFNANNRMHKSAGEVYNKHDIKLTSIRGLKDLKEGVKDKDKDISVFEDRGVGKGWNTKPGQESQSLALPDIKVGAVIELFKITKQSDVSNFQVQGLWNVFKVQNFTGKKFYQNEGDAYSHFINWCKTQNIENGSTHKQSSSRSSGRVTKSSGAEKLIDSLRDDLNA